MKKMFVALLVFSTIISAQKKFKYELDYSQFYHSDTSNYVEFYYSFYPDQLVKTIKDSKQEVSGKLIMVIKDKITGTAVFNKTYQFKKEPGGQDLLTDSSNLSGVLAFNLNHGNYKLYSYGFDANSEQARDSIIFDLDIKKYPADKFSISDIQVSSSIKEADENSDANLTKNGYEIIPNPGVIFGKNLPVLFTYTELYNLVNIMSTNLILTYSIYDAANTRYYNKKKLLVPNVNSAVEINFINVSKIPTGSYNLIISLIDSVRNYQVFSLKRIFIYNPDVVDTLLKPTLSKDVFSSEYAVMTEEDLNEEYSWVKYIATDKEKTKWKIINTLEGKRNFLFDFWKIRTDNQSVSRNALKFEYKKRVELADRKYTKNKLKGSNSDRGRVLIQHGEPSEIEKFTTEPDTRPYEIWHYNELQNGVVFVFADLNGLGEYDLIHSNYLGELKDDNWKRRVRM